ncbi:tetratricopeptide repeat protein [Candidatus Thorarchaeota archaeon]|nr:MAG: tetratricopeptide repeat protein [Candidatus Thorarchaeota archaeon]
MNSKTLTDEITEAFNSFNPILARNKFEELYTSVGPAKALEILVDTIHNCTSDSWFLQNVHLLSIFNCKHLSGINSALLTQLPKVAPSLSIEELKEEVIRFFYEITKDQIESGDSTLFFNFKNFGEEHADITHLGLERRQIELISAKESLIQSLKEAKDTDLIDLILLWRTHYGFESLAQMYIGRYIEKSKIQPIMEFLETFESEIKESNKDDRLVKLSHNKLQLVEGISSVFGGISLWTKRNEKWNQPTLTQIQETVTSLDVIESTTINNLLLEILAATWLFPKNSHDSWIARYQILRINQSQSIAEEYNILVTFLNSLDCSDNRLGKYSEKVLTTVLQKCIDYNMQDIYANIVKMLMCLGKNHDSVKSHIALKFLRENYIEKIIEDLVERTALNNWLNRNLECFHVDEFKTLVLDAFKKDTEQDIEHFKRWDDVRKAFMKLKIRDAPVEIAQHMHLLKPEDLGFLNDYGVALAEAERIDEAKVVFEILLKQNPSDSVYMNNLAYVIYLSGDCEEALQLSEKAITLSDRYHHSWHTYGAALHCLGRFKEAEKAYRKSIECERSHFDAWDDLIRLLEEMKRYDEVEKEKTNLAKIKSSMFLH